MGKYEHKEKNNVLIFHDIIPDLELVKEMYGDSHNGKLFLAVMHYSRDNEIPKFSKEEVPIQLIFNRIKASIDTNRKKYEETCIKNANNRNSKQISNSADRSQFIDSETGELIETITQDTEENDSSYDPDTLTEKMIQDYFVKEKKIPLTTRDSLKCLEYCITNSSTGRSWKQNADSWFTENKSSAV